MKRVKSRARIDPALSFLDEIESPWKEQESFAIWLVQKMSPHTIVNIGFDRGFSLLAFAYKNQRDVFGIEWFEEGDYASKSFILDAAFRNISLAISLEYARNIHLIIGPFCDVSKKWTRKIDILHIDQAFTYAGVKRRYTDWQRYLKPGSIILLHGVSEHPAGPGRFFQEQLLPKVVLPQGFGLGVLSEDAALIEEIRQMWAGDS